MANENSDSTYQGVKRNSPCPCGSGKRFKHCHGKSLNDLRRTSASSEDDLSFKLFSNDDLFCSITGKYYELGKQQYLFVADESDIRIQLDTASVYLMQELEVFSTYKEHFENFSRKIPITKEQFQEKLRGLHKERCIETAKSFVDSLKVETVSTSLDEVAGICIRTCDSPYYLKRILESQTRRTKMFGANEKVYIFDDSTTIQAQKENEQIVANFSHTIEVFYFGLEWQKEFVGALVDIFPDDEKVIKAMLLPQENVSFSGGRTMNLAILFFAGKRYLSFDDDLILDDARLHSNSNNETIQVGIRPDRVYDGYSNEELALKAGTPIDVDPLTLHKKALGLNLFEYGSSQSNYQFNSKSVARLRAVDLKRFNSKSFIITTDNGRAGTTVKRDGRFIFSSQYINLSPPWKTSDNFEQLLNGSYCWDSISQTEVIGHGWCSPVGINNTQLLAATVSTCKSEDVLLCFMASVLHPNSVHLGFPWPLAHFRSSKDWYESTYNHARLLQLPDLIRSITSNIELSSSISSNERLVYIAANLLKIASLPESEFKKQLQSLQVEKTTFLIDNLQKQVELLTNDDKYKSNIEQIIKNEFTHLNNDSLPSIEDAHGITESEQIKWAQQELKAYAQGLSIWPKLWHYCADSSKFP